MKDLFIDYVVKLYKKVPTTLVEGLVLVSCLVAVLMMVRFGIRKGTRYLLGLLLFEYALFLYFTTVFVRTFKDNQEHDFRPFWSYAAIQDGREQLLPEIIMNVVVFVPVGFLLGCAIKNMTWWKVMIIGTSVSGAIETMQFVYNRGFAEVDDVMHNTLGCMIGYGFYSLVRSWYERIGNRSV